MSCSVCRSCHVARRGWTICDSALWLSAFSSPLAKCGTRSVANPTAACLDQFQSLASEYVSAGGEIKWRTGGLASKNRSLRPNTVWAFSFITSSHTCRREIRNPPHAHPWTTSEKHQCSDAASVSSYCLNREVERVEFALCVSGAVDRVRPSEMGPWLWHSAFSRPGIARSSHRVPRLPADLMGSSTARLTTKKSPANHRVSDYAQRRC